ncbi:uncharacterized protein LOC131321014 [Rhododendron vialii]|uniref:uncharacterized protein LOC131321014 n=1 Tax=Rhododendron vialii TaxID=182163 RepID=UPI00265D730D|nr:uncharacterized protein LOC131321014 [Rhododendron vialii]
MLEDIFKLPYLKRTWERVIKVHGYIYNRPTLLNMMRYFTQRNELIKPAKTRFATACLTLQMVHQQKNNLRKMFTSEAWSKNKWAKEADGKKVAEIMLSPSFWNNVLLALKFACPLVKVLRLVDGEEKPAKGYIYEAMDRAKETIINTFGGDEDKYKTVFEIIDARWEVQLHQPLHSAGYYLNPAFFYKDGARMKADKEVWKGLVDCIERLVPTERMQDEILHLIALYEEEEEGIFKKEMQLGKELQGHQLSGVSYLVVKLLNCKNLPSRSLALLAVHPDAREIGVCSNIFTPKKK